MTTTKLLYYEDPDCLEFEAKITRVLGNRITLDRTAFYPKGGGQPSDVGKIIIDDKTYQVEKVEKMGGELFHVLDNACPETATIAHGYVDPQQRWTHSAMHTALHVLNAIIFRRWQGAKVTGAQINSDGTARMDFDLPNVDIALVRDVESEVNRTLAEDRPVRIHMIPQEQLLQNDDLVRTANRNAPADENGMVRIVEIQELDRQACGGTHVASTAQCGQLKFSKVKSKGHNNRRINVQLIPPAEAMTIRRAS